ncbi:MAG: DUF6055 domain-containing protein [Pseudomonadota bacterium]|nr:DUF6055 domain-containing protein [Pseudomonadota bacterium]
MDCLLPDVLAALSGEAPADTRMVVPPAAFTAGASGRSPGSARAVGKGAYGTDLAFHVDGANFTVQWEDATVDPARADAILAQLEAAWPVLVDDGGWPAPVSSDTYLLRVVLDPELGGSGYTTVYPTDDYPEGYPVSYLNPAYDIADPEFGLSVAVHEFGHMLQYRLRDWQGGRADSWYWEATSEWVAERAAPTLDTYAESSYWYAQWPDARFDRVERYHGYGMLLLNAYLDERVFGLEGIRDVWIAGEGNVTTWDVLIEGVAGRDFGELMAGMAGEVAARTLRESNLYDTPIRVATHDQAPEWEVIDAPELYGSHLIDVGSGEVTVEGDVALAYVIAGELGEMPADGPYTLVVTALSENGEVAYGLARPVEEEEEVPVAACGCGGGFGGGWLGVGLGLLAVRRRAGARLPSRTGPL